MSGADSEVSGDDGQDISGVMWQMARSWAMAGSEDKTGCVNMFSGNLGVCLDCAQEAETWATMAHGEDKNRALRR